MNFKVGTDRLLTLPLRSFAQRVAQALPKLFAFLCSDELKEHPLWGRYFPLSVPVYGTGRSLGHVVRPDIVLTEDGPRICEFDFVPSGRAFLLAALPGERQKGKFLLEFANWYVLMGGQERGVVYATADQTTCFEETTAFAKALDGVRRLAVRAVNVDQYPVDGQIIDRLFYRSEIRSEVDLRGKDVITAEPWLDSKMVFALIHDPDMEAHLTQVLGLDAFLTLQEACPETYVLETILESRPALIARMLRDQRDWVLKSTDVETDHCWGCRGVVVGKKYTGPVFRRALVEQCPPPGKCLGAHPIVQRFIPSVDFRPVWDGVVDGNICATSGADFGKAEEVHLHAQKPVTARLGCYVLIENVTHTTRVPPFGLLTLRQDELAHGASDAIVTAFALE